jgi:hypothetical protein
METLSKLILVLTKNNQINLNKRRELRIQFVKKETQLLKAVEDEKHRAKHLQSESTSH